MRQSVFLPIAAMILRNARALLGPPPPSTAPANTVAPVISGTAQVGEMLTAPNGTWTGTPTIVFTYRWRRDGADIAGATSSTYLLITGDLGASITARVTGTNGTGPAAAVSNALGPVIAAATAPANTVAPVISGTAQVGQTLTATNGTWTGTPTIVFTYQWRRDGADIPGATASTYSLVTGDLGTNIVARVTGTNGTGTAAVVSNGLGSVIAATPTLLANKLVLFIGDSTTAGVGAGDGTGAKPEIAKARPFSFPIQARDRLLALAIPAMAASLNADNNNGYTNTSWNEYRPEITIVGTLGLATSGNQTAGGAQVRFNGSGQSLTFSISESIDAVDFWQPRVPGGGVLAVSIDGAAAITFTSANATPVIVKQTISGLSLGPHTVAFMLSSGTAYAPIAVNAYNSSVKSVQIMNAGSRAWKTTNWVAATFPNSPLNAIGALTPNIVVINLGINDYRVSGTSIATFTSNMQAIINASTAVGAQVILCVPTPISSYNTGTYAWSQAAVLAAYQSLQAANPGSVLIDTPALLSAAGLSGAVNPANYSSLNAAGNMYDNLHPNKPPYAAMGVAIGDAIRGVLGL